MSSSGAPLPLACLLDGCNKPRHVDPESGVAHDYCGRTHAREAASRRGESLGSPHGICHSCKRCGDPVYFEEETQRVHEFCSRTCAQAAIADGEHPPSKKGRGPYDPTDNCALPGCQATRFYDTATGVLHDFCGRTHARLAATRGLTAHPIAHVSKTFSGRPPAFGCAQCSRGGAQWCVPCGEHYTLSVLTNAHPKYAGIKQQFAASWRHPGAVPTVLRVLQVRNPPSTHAAYTQYKASLGPNPNELRRFHATGMKCSFGADQEQAPCSDADCAVCTIAQRGFSLAHAGSGSLGGWLRFGRGIYFSKVSSKSHDYGSGTERLVGGETLRCMFLCKVAVGASYETSEQSLTQPEVEAQVSSYGQGGRYQSVVGLAAEDGGALNYEETVVYEERAAIPSYLVVYRV